MGRQPVGTGSSFLILGENAGTDGTYAGFFAPLRLKKKLVKVPFVPAFLFRGAQPILQSQPLDPGEFSFVVSDDHVTKRQRLSRNQQVIVQQIMGADWCACLLQTGTKQSVARVRRNLEGQDFQRPKHCV